MEKVEGKRHKAPLRFGIASISCPVLTVLCVRTYQQIAHARFWQAINTTDDADRAAAMMMGVSEVVQLFFFLFIACLVGALLALESIRVKRKFLGLGGLALVING